MFGRLRAALGAEEKGLRGTVKDALAGRLPGKPAPEAPPAKPGPPEAAAGRVERSAAGAARAEGAVASAPRPSPEAPAAAERLGGEAEPSAALVGSVDVAPEAAIAPALPEEPVAAVVEVAPATEIVAPVAATAAEPAVAAPPVAPEPVVATPVAPEPVVTAPAAPPSPVTAPTPAAAAPEPAPVKLSLAAAAAAAARAPEKLLHADQGSTDLDHYIARAKANNRDVGAIRGGIGINRAEDGTPYWGPVDNESSRAKAAGHLLAIDQWECISCGTCVEQTDKVFVLPADGKAAPVAQDGPMDLIQDAIEACPVTCIHWVSEGEATERGLATSFQEG